MFEEFFSDQTLIDFDDLANLLLEEGAQESPSAVHGAICGVLVGGFEREPDYCLTAVSQALELELRGGLAEYGLRLIAATVAALQDEEFDFHPLLPDDEIELELRLQALAAWASAFLKGFASAATTPRGDSFSDEVAEVLKDMAAIADLDPDPDEDENEAEGSYFELTEYLRFSCLNLFMECEDEREAGL